MLVTVVIRMEKARLERQSKDIMWQRDRGAVKRQRASEWEAIAEWSNGE